MRFVCIIIALLIFNAAQARQSTDFNYVGFSEIGLSSPTASGLGEYASVPVSMATGIPSISIPLTTITAGDISVPISLSYHSAGIKVTEYPGELGLGWSLNAGGVITRVVKGYQDELDELGTQSDSLYQGYWNWANRINNFNHTYWQDSQGQYDPDKFNSFLRQVAKNRVDAEPDVYFYNCGAYSGFFVIDGQGEFVTFPDANIGIQYPVTDTKGVVEFILTTEDGKQYKFADREFSRRETVGNESPNPLFPDMVQYPYDKSHTTAWYLSEISSPHTIQKVKFDYHQILGSANSIESIGSSTIVNKLRSAGYTGPCTEDGWTITTSRSKSRVESYVRLFKVYVENGHQKEVLVQYQSDPDNFPLKYNIDRIEIENSNGQGYYEYNFGYIDDTGSEGLLLLDYIQKEDAEGNTQPKYEFTYELGISQVRQSVNRDFLGYPRPSRGTSSDHLIGVVDAGDDDTGIGNSMTPDLSYTEAGVLHKIEYPTGGFTQFDYELNEAIVDGVSMEVGGLRIKKITSNADNPESPPIVKTYEYGEGDVAGFEGVLSKGAFFDTNRIYSVINGENCYQEIGVADPQTPLFGHFITYDYVREIIDYGNGGARTEVYDELLNGNNGQTYYGSGSDGVYYRKALPLYSRTEIKADSSNPEMNTPEYLTIFETKNEYDIYTGPKVGGYFSDIQSLLWRRPDFQLKNIVTAQGTTVDTTYAYDSGLYKRMWAYKTKETSTHNVYTWVQKDTVYIEGSTIIMQDLSEYVNKSISNTSEFEYDTDHKQLTKQTDTNSDNSKLITNYEYAHLQAAYDNLAMVDSVDFSPMIISAPYSIIREDGSGNDLGASWVKWDSVQIILPPDPFQNIDTLIKWNPNELWVWEGLDNSDTNANLANAIKKVEVNSYDLYGNPLETTNSNGVSSRFFYGSNSKPFSQDGILSGSDTISGYYLTGIQREGGTGFDTITGGIRPTSGDDYFTEATYDTYGRIDSIVDENEESNSFEYDGFNRFIRSFNSSSGVSSTDYFYSKTTNGTYDNTNPNYVQSTIGTEYYGSDFESSSGFSQYGDRTFNYTFDNEKTLRLGDNGGNWSSVYRSPGALNVSAKVDFYPSSSYTNSSNPAYALSLNDGTSGTPNRFSVRYRSNTDRFYIHYKMNDGDWVSGLNFPLVAAPNKWYTVEVEKNGGEMRAWVYERGKTRVSGNYQVITGFPEDWTPQVRVWSRDDYVYFTNLEITEMPVISSSYFDGLGRQIQSQQKGITRSIISGTVYDESGNSTASSKPFEQNTNSFYLSNVFKGSGSFTPGNALPSSSPIENYYDPFFNGEEDYAYSFNEFEPMPGGRSTSSRMPGGINYTSTTSYDIVKNHIDSLEYFDIYAQNKFLNKTTSINPDTVTSIAFSDSWGRTIASGIDVDWDGKLDGKNKSICTGVCDLITEFEYDERGNLIKVIDPDNLITTYSYNQLGQLIKKDTPDIDPIEYLYDDHGNLRFIENASHAESGDSIAVSLDQSSAYLVKDIDPVTNGVLSFEVNIETQYGDYLTRIVDDAHSAETLIREIAPYEDGWETTASRSMLVRAGNYKFYGDPESGWDGSESTDGDLEFKPFKYSYTKYDDQNRPIEVGEYIGNTSFENANANNSSFPSSDKVELIIYKYDGGNGQSGARNLEGRLAQVWYYDPNDLDVPGKTYYSYNELGLVEWIEQDMPGSFSSKIIRYTYDNIGRLTRIHFDPSGTSDDHYFWYYYDEFGRVSKVTSYGSNSESSALTEVEFTYFANGQIDQLILGEGAQTLDYEYTIQGWVDMINDPSSSSNMGDDVFGVDLSYSNAGNITNQLWRQVGESTSDFEYFYNYDRANRLDSACFDLDDDCRESSSNFDVLYEYHRNGRLKTLDRYGDSGSIVDDLDYNYLSNKNILDNVSTLQFSNDPMGNITENQVQGIDNTSYDWRNLPNWLVANNNALLYTYDASGKRVKKELVDNSTTYYIRGADGQTIAAYDGSGNLLFLNILSGGQIIGQIEN
jgi:YD repeat-containing protein